MASSNVDWKLLQLIADAEKDNNSSVLELPSLGNCGIRMLHCVYNTG